jgi:hypothetical protein
VRRLAYNGDSLRSKWAAGRGKRFGGWAFAKSHQLRGYLLVNIAMSKSSLISPDPDTPTRRHADRLPQIAGVGRAKLCLSRLGHGTGDVPAPLPIKQDK